MSVDPWDFLDEPEPAPVAHLPLTTDEVEAIRAEIKERILGDRALIPELHQIGFSALAELGMDGNPEATQAVRLMLRRALFGGPLEEYPRGEVA